MSEAGILHSRAKALNLHGLLANWDEAFAAGWAQRLLGWEEEERARRSLERRIRAAHIGRFKPLCDFDWNWPKSCDRAGIEGLMQLDPRLREDKLSQGCNQRCAHRPQRHRQVHSGTKHRPSGRHPGAHRHVR